MGNIWKNFAAWASAAAVALAASATVAAQEFGPSVGADPQYQQLVERLERAEQEIQVLRQREIAAPPSAHRVVDAGGNPLVPAPEQRLSAVEKAIGKEDHGPHFPTARLSGFFHLDSGLFDQDDANRAVLGDIQDGVGFRRARLQAVGKVAEFTNYSIEFDFATAGRPSFMDVWGEQTHVPLLGNVRIGHFREPFSLDGLTSIRQLEFLERSLPFQAFVPFRRAGVMAYDKSETELTTWAAGIFRSGGFNNGPVGDSRFATDIGDNGGFEFAGRVTHLLYYDEPAEGRYLLHVGSGYTYGSITSGTPTGGVYEARAIPEFFVGDPAAGGATAAGTPFFVDTGRLPADQFHLYNLELAGQAGPAHFQAEYFGVWVDQMGAPSVYYDGAYAQAGYFLTGEHRSYNKTMGALDSVAPFSEFFSLGRRGPFCGWGAWEVVGRWSFVDLTDPAAAPLGPPLAGPPSVPNPGRLHNSTLGLNWFWNTYTAVQLNWIHSFLDNQLAGNSDADIYAARFQVSF